MADNLDRDLQRLNQGKAATAAQEVLDAELQDREKAIRHAVYDVIRSGEVLDPQLAVQKWVELYAINQLRSSLRRRERAGQSAAKRLGSHLT